MILNFIKKIKSSADDNKNNDLIKIIALLIHAAKIDENYSEMEKKIIFNFAINFSKKIKRRSFRYN